MTTAQDLYEKAFNFPRDARSEPYRQGVRASIRYWLGEVRKMDQPYQLGTAAADAWFSGAEEGARIVRMNNATETCRVEYYDPRTTKLVFFTGREGNQ
jgi:hypothetical protein